MAIPDNPNRTTQTAKERKESAFIARSGKPDKIERERKNPVMIRMEPNIIARIDEAARLRGVTRSAFVINCTLAEVTRIEQQRD